MTPQPKTAEEVAGEIVDLMGIVPHQFIPETIAKVQILIEEFVREVVKNALSKNWPECEAADDWMKEAFKEGAEQMRERAAGLINEDHSCHGFLAEDIRALPLVESEKGGGNDIL